ncbi:MAG: carboxypeptidase-like regulatory domain-containing protein [Flavobacteriales bacterium]|nr:carboxypeptidase-like regulatory domain-containing protein [Flavobacteriales bacterium]
MKSKMRFLPGHHLRQLIGLFAMLLTLATSAQTTRVSGKVVDGVSGELLPFVNVGFLDTRISTNTDFDGLYKLETYYATDSIRATCLGYRPVTIKVKKDQAQVIDITMQPSSGELKEVVVTYLENSAFAVLRQVVRNKPANNRAKLAAYEYESYNKVEFDLNNITEDFKNKKLFKDFKFIFDYVDTTTTKESLPIFMTETLSDVYYRQDPKTRREIIRGNRISGIENESITQFMGDMYQNVNVYENFLTLFGKNFVSPVADGGSQHYDYLLVDSNWVDHAWCYQIRFKPKHQQQLCFSGEMWINDTSFAVRRLDAGIEPGTNINFVQELKVHQEYDQVAHEVYMLTKDQLMVDLNPLRDDGEVAKNPIQGFYGRRNASYKEFKINQPKEEAFYNGVSEVIVDEDPLSESADFWDQHRHTQLSKRESDIYQMVDTMKRTPKFRNFMDLISTVVTGYYTSGQVEIGPYFNLYSFNPVEGNRFRIGMRTSNKFSKRIEYTGFLAYGTLDEEFKYGLGAQGFISKDPRQLLGVFYTRDIEQLGQSINAFKQDNILSSFLRRSPNNKLTLVDEFKVTYERDWFQGFSTAILFRERTLYPRGDLVYLRFRDLETSPVSISSIRTSEIAVNTRYAYREKFVSGTFRRVSLGSKYPAFELHTAFGLKNIFGSNYEYEKIIARVSQRIPTGVFGNLRYAAETGRVFGTLPYPLLIVHPGNETFYYDESAYNTMNFFEFISDRYASLSLQQHFDGYFLNRIPLLRRLKWREVIGVKGLIGDLDRKHASELLFLPIMRRLNDGPFVEASAGLENVFKVLRIDGIWRLTYRDSPRASLFALRVKLNINF